MDALTLSAVETPTTTRLGRVVDAVRDGLAEFRVSGLGDGELLASLDVIEQAGRLVDAARVAVAAEAAERSAKMLGRESLAWRAGCSGAADLITRATRVSLREAHRRIKLGDAVAAHVDVLGVNPSRFPAVAAALTSGGLGVDAAEVIVSGLGSLPGFCTAEEVSVAERSLVATATGAITDEIVGLPGAGIAFSADLIRGQVEVWRARLDPDGAAPSDPVLEPRSSIGFGRLTQGAYPLRGQVTPEMRGVFDSLFDAYLSAHCATRFPSATEQEHEREREPEDEQHSEQHGAEDNDTNPLGLPIIGDDRTTDQRRADILRGVLDSAARDTDTPQLGGAAPAVAVHVNAVDLADDDGVGWVEGVEAPVSMRTVRQLICAGGIQKIVLADNGRVLRLGETERFFNRSQRRAIGARDETCIIPGCTVPARWAEIHHVIPWQYHGKTDVDNGVLLCWYHHHSIETSGWLIRMAHSVPEVKAPKWMGGTGQWAPTGPHRAHGPTRARKPRT